MWVSKTTNTGTSWVRYMLSSTGYTYALAVDPTNSNVVYAGGNPSLYKTVNGGTNWNECAIGLVDWVYDIAIDPTNTSVIYVGTDHGVYKTTNGGVLWTPTGCAGVSSVVIDPLDTDCVYAGTQTGVYKTTNGGGNWTVMNDSLDDTYITSLGIYPGTYLYCGTGEAGMYRWSLQVGVEEARCQRSPIDLIVTPNPVKNNAVLYFLTPGSVSISLVVYNIAGKKVRTLVEQTLAQGQHGILWDGKDDHGLSVPSGVYFGHLKVGQQNTACQMIVLE
jgi:photosystem II stability/assembly factor-like uncharacterized protein